MKTVCYFHTLLLTILLTCPLESDKASAISGSKLLHSSTNISSKTTLDWWRQHLLMMSKKFAKYEEILWNLLWKSCGNSWRKWVVVISHPSLVCILLWPWKPVWCNNIVMIVCRLRVRHRLTKLFSGTQLESGSGLNEFTIPVFFFKPLWSFNFIAWTCFASDHLSCLWSFFW